MKNISELSKCVRNALLQGSKIELFPIKKKIKWKGPSIHESLAHVNLDFHERFSPKYLKQETEQGRDFLDVIILIALQLGIGQGMEITKKYQNLDKALIKALLAALKNEIKKKQKTY
jgi:hypothetical protein